MNSLARTYTSIEGLKTWQYGASFNSLENGQQYTVHRKRRYE